MANMRNHNVNVENNMENNNATNPPPPPLPTLEQVLAMQAQMLQLMQQTMINMQNVQLQALPLPPWDKLVDIQCSKPPTFSHSIELMDVDDCLRSMGKKLQVVQYNNHEKVLLDTHQLSGPTANWWDTYIEAHEEPEGTNWPEFRATFCTHHVLQGVLKLKKKEFQDLKAPNEVNEYVTRFTQLSCYAPNEVDTDENKQECFLNDLNNGLAYALEAWDIENFQGMVIKALVLENHRGVMERKRKLMHQHQLGGSSRPHVATSSAGPVFHTTQLQFQVRP
jgi:hypothetical protein